VISLVAAKNLLVGGGEGDEGGGEGAGEFGELEVGERDEALAVEQDGEVAVWMKMPMSEAMARPVRPWALKRAQYMGTERTVMMVPVMAGVLVSLAA
jgi:hypothetical protein